jgi:hypothetical protein
VIGKFAPRSLGNILDGGLPLISRHLKPPISLRQVPAPNVARTRFLNIAASQKDVYHIMN